MKRLLTSFFFCCLGLAPVKPAYAFNWTERSMMALSSTAVSFYFDESVRSGMQKWDHTEGPTKKTMILSERYGGLVAPGLALLSYPIFSATSDSSSRWLRVSKQSFYSVLLYTVVSSTLKFSIGRHRPYQGGDPNERSPFSTRHSSFPSGHTGTAFAFSTSLAIATDSLPLQVVLFSAATLAGVSRLYDRKHWFSDTVAGAWLGGLSALVVHEEILGTPSDGSQSGWMLLPILDPESRGLRLVSQFN